MNIHAIVDYSFLYYKYKFQLDSGKMRRLTAKVKTNEGVCDKDISQIFYSLKEIEGFRRTLEKAAHNVTLSVCFDMPSSRKLVSDGASNEEIEAANEYKSNRVKRLSEDDFENIKIAEKLLNEAGYNTYRMEGIEADDIIANLIKQYKNKFDYNIIYTPDADLLVNIDTNVGAQRYKVFKGYQSVDINNFEQYLSAEYKCNIRYNNLMLFKACCGDSSDKIAGIKKFGPKAFDKLTEFLSNKNVDWVENKDSVGTEKLIEMCRGYLTDEQIAQAKIGLSMVEPVEIVNDKVEFPNKHSTTELRQKSYSVYEMKSLYE